MASRKRTATARPAFLVLIAASASWVDCVASDPVDHLDGPPTQETTAGESTQQSEAKKKAEPASRPAQYPAGGKPQLPAEPPEGINAVVTSAEVREPNARYSAPDDSPIYLSEVPVSLGAVEEFPEGVRPLLTSDIEEAASRDDLVVIEQPAERAYGSSYRVETDEEGAVRFRGPEGETDLVVEPTALFSAMGAPAGMQTSVIYDEFAERFLIVALASRDEADPNVSSLQIFVGVSQEADPKGEWFGLALENPRAEGVTRLAFDAETLYIVVRDSVLPDGQASVWVIDKGVATGGFYAGGLARVYRWSQGKGMDGSSDR